MTERERMQQLLRQSRETGKPLMALMDRTKLAKEFPRFASDPRLALTGERFIMHFAQYKEILVGELRELCRSRMNHPLAAHFLLCNAQFSDERIVYIRQYDYDTLANAAASPPDEPAPPPNTPSTQQDHSNEDVSGQIPAAMED